MIVAALITPLMLATAPVTIETTVTHYSHLTQGASAFGSGMSASMNSMTANGTRTYDYRGNPNDSDNDSDNDPY